MRRKTLFTVAIALAGAAAVAVAGPFALRSDSAPTQSTSERDLPSSFGTAQLKALKVVSGVVITEKDVVMNGGWFDTTVSCLKNRRLTVQARVVISAPGASLSRTVRRNGSFKTVNCAEGGPSVGFVITARKAKAACADGSWKPGVYGFITTTIEPTRKLKAQDSLVWDNRNRC